MSYAITISSILKGGELSLADNTVLERGKSLTVTDLSSDMLAAYNAGLIIITPSPPSFTQASKVTITNNVGGTAPTIVGGAVTFAAVVDIPTAANAIRGLIAQIVLMNSDHTNTLTQLASLQTQLASLSKKVALKLG